MTLQNTAKLLFIIILTSLYTYSQEYHIIAGSFSSKKNAEKMIEKIATKGISASIIESDLKKGKFYRVSIGNFNSISEAKKTLSDLSNKLEQNNLWIFTNKSETSQTQKEKLEQERIARENAEKAKLQQERIARENAEKAQLEQKHIARENAEKAKLEQERIARENAEKAKLEQERIARENAEKAQLEQERIARENAEKAKLEQTTNTKIITDEKSNVAQSAVDNTLHKEEEIIQKNDIIKFSGEVVTPYPKRENEPQNLNIANFLKTFKIIINTIERQDEARMKQYIHPSFGFILTYQNEDKKELLIVKSLKEFFELAPIQSNLEQINKDFKTTRLSIPKVGSLPAFDCEQMKFNGMGLFAVQIKYLENQEINFSNSNISNLYQSYLKVSDFEVVNSENKKIYSIYFTLIDGNWYLSMINMIPPCD